MMRKFRKRYGRRPLKLGIAVIWDVLFDCYVTGNIDGYDAANKMHKKKKEEMKK